ncbi:hypothetical protein B0H16DRAFT_1468399 [Mycena metata]|uniref:Uncharacterized protein n=1 Tax=Mycena metata TaxID=1033252 RepID=A0AAD7I192_9AGAR|nr:hypothetical protein B0H16DRAFT_1468399 [Mycena metata]
MGAPGGAGRRVMAPWLIRGQLFMPDLMVIFSWISEHTPPRHVDVGHHDGRAGRGGAARDGALADPGPTIYAGFNEHVPPRRADVGHREGRAGRGRAARDAAATSAMMRGGDDPDDASDGGTARTATQSLRKP